MTMADGVRSVVYSSPVSPLREPASAPTGGRRSMLIVSRCCAAGAALLAILALLGWILELPELERLVPGWATMRANTAIAVLLLAATQLVPRRWTVPTALLAAALPCMSLLESATSRSLGIDQLLFRDPDQTGHPGRTSLAAATCLGLLAVTHLLIAARRRVLAQVTAIVVLLTGGLMLLGYAYGVQSLYSFGPFSTSALPTALCVVFLPLAVLAGLHDGVLQWSVFSHDAGASLVRRQLPLALVGLPIAGYLCLELQHHAVVEGSTPLALLTTFCALAVGVSTWLAARQLTRLERRRAQVLADLTDLKLNLQQQVADRAAQVQLRRDEIAVLEDRHRIAADLHDIVIQRLFAAGMFLQGANEAAIDADTARRMQTAIESMDGAIRDLRNAIFQLGGGGSTSVDLASELDSICVEAARVLGFTPELTVDDPESEAETVREDVLAVLRESLANVARHAGASAVSVTLRTGHGLIALTVIDDGRGISEPPHSSGTRNMAERARRRGGDCVWTTAETGGTRVWWYVPGAHAADAAPSSDPPGQILAVDENVVVLENLGVVTTRAESGAAAVVDRPAVLGDA